jgi:type III pantothenate kinase
VLDQPECYANCLLLDIGNTGIKYAWYCYPNDIADLQILRTSTESLPDLLASATSCLFCSVKGKGTNQQIIKLCQQNNVRVEQAHTLAIQFGLQNAYETISNMGTDRWVAMLAGGALTSNNYLIIDAGTAITCDFVINNQHKGGWIAPGLKMARQAVVRNTQRVFDDQSLPFTLNAGVDTPDCVAQGALAQLTGMIAQAISMMHSTVATQLDTERMKFDVFMSGGDAPLLIGAYTSYQQTLKFQPVSSININFVENLVLVGLARIAHENAATSV